MSLVGPIVISGLAEWQASVSSFSSSVDRRVQKMVAMAAAGIVADARTLIPRGPSGRARASLTARDGLITGGGSKAPYFGWLVFGGRVGRRDSVRRSFVPGGRWIWPTWMKSRTDILTSMENGLMEAAREAGL